MTAPHQTIKTGELDALAGFPEEHANIEQTVAAPSRIVDERIDVVLRRLEKLEDRVNGLQTLIGVPGTGRVKQRATALAAIVWTELRARAIIASAAARQAAARCGATAAPSWVRIEMVCGLLVAGLLGGGWALAGGGAEPVSTDVSAPVSHVTDVLPNARATDIHLVAADPPSAVTAPPARIATSGVSESSTKTKPRSLRGTSTRSGPRSGVSAQRSRAPRPASR